MKSVNAALFSALMMGSLGSLAAAPQYTLTLIEGMTFGQAINNSGAVVGNSVDSWWNTEAKYFSLAEGVKVIGQDVVGGLGNSYNDYWAYDINDAGEALVSYTAGVVDSLGQTTAFYNFSYLQNVKSKAVVYLGQDTDAFAVNNSGVIAGRDNQGHHVFGPDVAYTLNDGGVGGHLEVYGINGTNQTVGVVDYRPAVWRDPASSPAVPALLDTGGFAHGYAAAINTAGVSVGAVSATSFFGIDSPAHEGRAALWDGEALTLLELGVFSGSDAWDINAAGNVVGSASVSPDAATVAVLWHEGELIDLNAYLSEDQKAQGWTLSYASGINDSGWIVGTATNQNGPARAFLLHAAAVPEPSGWMALMGGLALIVLTIRRRPS